MFAGGLCTRKLLEEQHDPRIKVFVIWEPVLPTDLAAPSTMTLKRLSDLRVSQYWDKEHLVSKAMGETDGASVVWDYIAVYQPGRMWEQSSPEPVYSRAPVVKAIDETREALRKQLESDAK
jgi:hypothetical protein